MRKKNFLTGWFLLIFSILLGLILIFSGELFSLEKRISLPFGFIILAFASYLVENIKEVRAPNVAFLFQMGKFVGRLDPGWYLIVPKIWEIEEIHTEWKRIQIEGDMYTNQQTLIVVKAEIYYRANEKKLDKILRMPPNEMEKRAIAVSLAKLRGVIGEKRFDELITKKGELEQAVKKILKDEFEKYGYIIRDFEIYDFDEKVWSEAEKIKALGKARADAEGRIAEALARPLKNNWPAAIAKSAEEVSDSLVKFLEIKSANK